MRPALGQVLDPPPTPSAHVIGAGGRARRGGRGRASARGDGEVRQTSRVARTSSREHYEARRRGWTSAPRGSGRVPAPGDDEVRRTPSTAWRGAGESGRCAARTRDLLL